MEQKSVIFRINFCMSLCLFVFSGTSPKLLNGFSYSFHKKTEVYLKVNTCFVLFKKDIGKKLSSFKYLCVCVYVPNELQNS